MQTSRRAHGLTESATLKVTRKASELRAAGYEIIDFGAGEPDFDSPPVAVAAARQALADGFTRYTPAAGTPDLRAALASRYQNAYQTPWTAANSLITVGAKAALFEIILTLIDDADEVILPYPAWVSFEEQIRFAGGHPVPVPLSPADRFAIHADPVLAALSPRTRMVLLNSPANPTGGIIQAKDLRQIVAACAARGIWVLCDETYERFVYGGAEHASCAALAAEFPSTVILVGSFSKTYAMTGWRIGFALGPQPLIRKVIELQSHATSNVTSFAMQGALAALRGAEADVQRMIAEFAWRRDFLVERLCALPGVSCEPPDGAFYAFPNVAGCYRPGRQGSIEFSNYLLEKVQVAVVPGAAFGNDDHIRISFACSRENLANGLERIRLALTQPESS